MKYKIKKPEINPVSFDIGMEVYDLSVIDNHSYCVGNDCVIVHNCSTFNETGFGSPMFSAALEAGRWAKVPVILDGGIRDNGDFAKAVCAFTSAQKTPTYGGTPQFENPINVPMVMAGSIFAACVDAPGETVVKTRNTGYWSERTWYCNGDEQIKRECEIEKKTFKIYYGSASAESKKRTGQEVKHVEGKTVLLECNNLTYEQKFAQIKGAIQSQISYAGGKDLTALKDVQWRVINK